MKKTICVGMMVAVLIGVLPGSASALSVSELLARIAELRAQVDGLMKQLVVAKELGKGEAFLSNLRAGMKNNQDVRRLQQFLIQRGYLDRGYDTGNFLSLTTAAIKRLQIKMGLPITGIFDKQTRDKVNELASGFGNVSAVVIETDSNGNTVLVKTATSTALVLATSTEDLIQKVITRTEEEYRIDQRPTYDIAIVERMTFDMINGERQKMGLSVLRWNDQLADVARAHSGDQAADNVKITDPDVACLYPYIRHEGFATGFRVGERLDSRNISYAMAGENLIIFPVTKDLIYRSTVLAPACVEFSDEEGVAGETQEAARTRVQKSLLDRIALMGGQSKLNWVNKQWKDAGELASESTKDWMNSPGHRHNILTPDFEEGAIGASIVNDYIIMTEVFLKKP